MDGARSDLRGETPNPPLSLIAFGQRCVVAQAAGSRGLSPQRAAVPRTPTYLTMMRVCAPRDARTHICSMQASLSKGGSTAQRRSRARTAYSHRSPIRHRRVRRAVIPSSGAHGDVFRNAAAAAATVVNGEPAPRAPSLDAPRPPNPQCQWRAFQTPTEAPPAASTRRGTIESTPGWVGYRTHAWYRATARRRAPEAGKARGGASR